MKMCRNLSNVNESVDKRKTALCHLVGYQFNIFNMYINTLFKTLFSQDIENQQITPIRYNVIMPCLRQNERNRAFGMLVT